MHPKLFGNVLSRLDCVQRIAALDDLLVRSDQEAVHAATHVLQPALHKYLINLHRSTVDTFNHNRMFWMHKREYKI